MRGLLGTGNLREDQGLWILPGNSIHTFFMNYAIDCVFLDRQRAVRSIHSNVHPWRIVWPQWRALSVIEMKAGRAKELNIHVGDQLRMQAGDAGHAGP
ncbi:MAG: DUF192 domain-containing protein [Bdellovibrio sp.]|nr:MAG: DUF192 domain-containing protein [Bdellovibrio sp.]